jgi:hypothetical protein
VRGTPSGDGGAGDNGPDGAVPGGAAAGRPMAGEAGSASARREMLLLLRAGLDRVPAVIPIGERGHVWRIIESSLSRNAPAADGPIAADPAGASAYQVGAAAEQARADARARALAAAISYGTWVRRHDREADLAEVFLVLDRHLNPDAEPSLVVRAVYGTEFPRLAHLARPWAAGAASRIFPPGDADRAAWDAAWGAYLGSRAPISLEVCDLLNDQYRLGVDRLGTGSDVCAGGRDVRLGRHLIARYWAGEITLDGDDQLMGRFYQRASTAVREQMTKYVGWNLLNPDLGTGTGTEAVTGTASVADSGTGTDSGTSTGSRTGAESGADADPGTGVLSRLARLWEERLAMASPSTDRDELIRFGEWFASGRFDDDWSLRQLARIITLTGDAKPDVLVLRHLAEIAPTRTRLCLDIISEWVRQLPEDAWALSVREEYLSRILALGLAGGDPGTRALAEQIINGAAHRGNARLKHFASLAPPDYGAWFVDLVVDEPVDKCAGPGG